MLASSAQLAQGSHWPSFDGQFFDYRQKGNRLIILFDYPTTSLMAMTFCAR